MHKPNRAEELAELASALENSPSRLEELQHPRFLSPVEMAAFIPALVETWKLKVHREGPFGSDFPTLCDVAQELYLAIEGVPVKSGMPTATPASSDPHTLAPVVLAAALSATVEVWKLSFEQHFPGYRANMTSRAPIEVVAKQVRAVIDVLSVKAGS